MKTGFGRLGRTLTVLAGLASGIGMVVLFVATGRDPEHGATAPRVPAVAVIEARPLEFLLEARGHGVARPAETWQAIANVPGRVVERHPELESGTLLRQGTLLLVLDPSRYELAVAEAKAELSSLAAEQAQLDKESANTGRLLELERERLQLAEQELERIERLAATGSVSRSQHDEQRRATLAQRQAVASLENTLALIPSRRDRLEAQIDRVTTRLEQARQDLADTRFEAPYDLRLGQVEVEMHQHVAAGQRLFEADSLAAAEVEAHIPFSMLRRLLGSAVLPSVAEDALDISERLDFSAIDAEVELVGAENVRWPARVTRVASGLDPGTRAARVVVTVDEPYRDALPPDRPPLLRDMYVRVRLSAANPDPLLAVPAAAVHQGEIYLVDENDQLDRRPVKVAFEQWDLAVIREGLAPGEHVIVDDLVPALNGMAVSPRRDGALEQHLRALARGEAQ